MIIKGHNSRVLQTVISYFRKGSTVVFPTDTVYGLGTITTKKNDKNVQKIFTIKNRPLTKPLSVLMTKSMLSKHIDAPPKIIDLLNQIWPARITVILKWKLSSQNILSPYLNTNKKRTLACRVPAHEFLLTILQEVDIPIVGTSANTTGTSPSFDFSKIRQNMSSKQIDLWIDHGILPHRLPSTIVDLTDPDKPKIIRQGDFDFMVIWKDHSSLNH